MPTTKKLIDEVLSLPVEDRAIIADSLLKSLNPPDQDIDTKWIRIAKRRLQEIRAGKAVPVSGEEVFAKVRERFGK
jgi:putative addiction module component (TIGR02574 family)